MKEWWNSRPERFRYFVYVVGGLIVLGMLVNWLG